MQPKSTVDQRELRHFAAAADVWWDESGVAKWIHSLNPLRLDYVLGIIATALGRPDTTRLEGLEILDLGCGAGVMCEPLAQRGAAVVGVDPAAALIETAQRHAREQGIAIDYRCTTPEALAEEGRSFDVVLALDVAEHVADSGYFLDLCAKLTGDGGVLIVSTMNRTIRSFLQTIVVAEYIARFLPRGSHRWSKFITPQEIEARLRPQGLAQIDLKGLTMDLRRWKLRFSGNSSVTYFMAFRRTRLHL